MLKEILSKTDTPNYGCREKIIEMYSIIDEVKPQKKSLFTKGKEKISSMFHKKDMKKEDNLEQIKKLKELLDMGAITQEEFEQKKKQLLDL